MKNEIERKFLVKDETYKTLARGVLIHQGFLNTTKQRVVRIRITGNEAFLTIKGINEGFVRKEFEYSIPYEDAKILLNEICEQPTLLKIRYRIPFNGLTWEVDEFLGENKGLVIAEVELQNENQELNFPYWVGKEVTNNPNYYNANLIKNPFSNWQE
jgi:CYTH domain-containing protein